MTVTLTRIPTEEEWMEAKRRALKTVGKKPKTAPDAEWKHKILEARHSPIRALQFSFDLTVPYWVSVHLVRHHEGVQPYVGSQRNDRQDLYDRTEAPQNTPVDMIWDLNAEALQIVANKRLCNQASLETRAVVREMCRQVEEACPEFKGLLVPLCVYCGGICHEMHPCERRKYGH